MIVLLLAVIEPRITHVHRPPNESSAQERLAERARALAKWRGPNKLEDKA